MWELASEQVPARRALTMLSAFFPDLDVAELADWPLGRRDAGLLALREAVFGPELDAVASCPDCGTAMELHTSVPELLAGLDGDGTPAAPVTVAREHFEISLRPVTTADLLALEPAAQPAGRDLVLRCVTAAREAGSEVEPASLPAEILASLGEELARTDPAATIELALSCTDCGCHWLAPFHSAAFLWAELNHWAGRMFLDVHRLALAYGWAEGDIVAMSPRRRQAYLDMVGP